MSNKHRFRYGEQDIINVPIPKNVGIEIGDFVCRALSADVAADTNLILNHGCAAGDLVDAGDAAANRERGADQLLGISLDYKASGDPATTIRVATAGFFELTQKSAAAIEIGAGVEIYASADNCENQTVVAGSTSPVAICAENKTSTSLTGVLCKLMPSLFRTINA